MGGVIPDRTPARPRIVIKRLGALPDRSVEGVIYFIEETEGIVIMYLGNSDGSFEKVGTANDTSIDLIRGNVPENVNTLEKLHNFILQSKTFEIGTLDW